MIINRTWAMPNSNTFTIKPIGKLIEKYIQEDFVIVDPFARNSKYGTLTNDIDPSTTAQYHMEATDFLRMLDTSSVDMVLFDPPYSPRQVSECYKSLDKTVNMSTTQSSFWTNIKVEISRILKLNGTCITFGWNSGGVGKKYSMNIIEILLIAHGGWHNDTICVVENKLY